MASDDKPNLMSLLTEVNKAFLPSRPVSDQELLAGRADQLFELMELTSTPGAHAAIYGERGVGKTSVVAVFEKIARNIGCTVGRINCTVNEDFGRVWTNMADHIVDIAAASSSIELSVAREAMDSFAYSQQPADVVRYLRKISSDTPLVLIFDEFDVLGDSSISESFANLMKAISDHEINVHLVVVGVAEDIDALLEGHASVARGLNQIKIPRLSQDELTDIVNRGSKRLRMTFDGRLTKRIVDLSQGLPHYTHLLAQQAARQAVLARKTEVDMKIWRPAVTSALNKVQQQVLDLYHQATASANKSTMYPAVLDACARADKDMQGFFRPADLVGPLRQVTGKNYQIPGFVKSLAALTESDRGPALETRTFADKRKRYRFTNPLLQPYILLRAAQREV